MEPYFNHVQDIWYLFLEEKLMLNMDYMWGWSLYNYIFMSFGINDTNIWFFLTFFIFLKVSLPEKKKTKLFISSFATSLAKHNTPVVLFRYMCERIELTDVYRTATWRYQELSSALGRQIVLVCGTISIILKNFAWS